MTTERRSGINGGAMTMGLLFIVVGVVFLLDRLGVLALDMALLWPAVLISLGVSLVAGGIVRRWRRG